MCGFPPQSREREQTLHQIRQSPQSFGVHRSRWTLPLLRRHCPPLQSLRSDSGAWRRLSKWRIVHKRGRLNLHSPDTQYKEKVAAIEAASQEARAQPDTLRLLYADEVSFYRQPFVGGLWQPKGRRQWGASLSHASNTRYRLAGTLDAVSGQVVWQGASKVGVKALCRWLAQIRAFYGPDLRLVLVWDNWPIHKHEQVLAAAVQNNIQILFLPTYAPWTNPIEKLWRKLKQEVLCLHRHSDDWTHLRQRVAAFMDGFAAPNADILRYVGLKTLTD